MKKIRSRILAIVFILSVFMMLIPVGWAAQPGLPYGEDFENWNTNEWSITATVTSTYTTSSDHPNAGTYAGRIYQAAAGGGLCHIDNNATSPANSTLNVLFYYYIESENVDATHRHRFAYVWESVSAIWILSLIDDGAGNTVLSVWDYVTNGWTDTAQVFTIGLYYKIEVSSLSTASGHVTVEVNDIQAFTKTGDFSARVPVKLSLGAYAQDAGTGSSIFHFDDVSLGAVPISVSADLENVDNGGADWVFTNWRYYTFTVTLGTTGLSSVSMYFIVPTSFENVACGFLSNSTDWIYESNMSYESRYGEPVILQAGTWAESNTTTTATFLVWFQDICLDVWEPTAAIPVYIQLDAGNWNLASVGLFRIYSKGGFSLNTESSNSTHAWILPGGTPFSFHVEDDGGFNDVYMYNEIWFRDVAHLKLLPEIHFLTGYDSFDLRYGCDYSFGDGAWETGWFFDINPETVHYNGLFTAAVWINMTVYFMDRSGIVSGEDLYMYNHGSITGNGEPGYWEMWIDLWFNSKNASSVGAGRVNAYEYAMEDSADLWLRWLSNNWGVMEKTHLGTDVFKEWSGEVALLDSSNASIMSSERTVMVRYWSRVQVYSAGGGQVIEIRNFEHFDETRSQSLPLTGVSMPVFDETITPIVGSKGLLGALWTMFASIGSFLSENVLFGGLNLWGSFVAFLDSIAGMFGSPTFFSDLFGWIAQLIGYLGNSMSYLATILTDLFPLFTALMGSFLTTMGDLLASLLNTLTYFTDMMGGAYGTGSNIWSDLGISQWIQVFLVFYPLYLIILWDQEGEGAVLSQLGLFFGILSWLFDFVISLVKFTIGLVTSVIESIPIAE